MSERRSVFTFSFRGRDAAPRQRARAAGADDWVKGISTSPVPPEAPPPGWMGAHQEWLEGLDVTEELDLDSLPPELADQFGLR